MILITHNLDSISITHSYLNDIVKGSTIEFISDTNELQDDIIYQFTDILNRVSYSSNNIENDWRIFKLLVGELKTIYHENKIISDYKDSISVLCVNLPAVKVARYFKQHLCNLDYMPIIVQKLQLTELYEQLVFYEYIYMYSDISYSYKLTCMIENNYNLLMELIHNCYIDTCSDSNQETKENMLNVYKTYFGSNSLTMFRRFEEHHERYLDYYGQITDRGTDIYNFILNNTNVGNSLINLSDLCYLNNVYQEHKVNIGHFIRTYYRHINFDITDNIVLYEVYDMIVKMMETDEKYLEVFSNRQLSKIFAKWMSMSNHNHERKEQIRDIVLSTTIKTILNTNNYTFNEMIYILTQDRLDMFIIVTRNLRFRTIHPDILKYMSPKITDYVFNKCMNITNEQKIDYNGKNIEINPYNLVDRTQHDIESYVRIINNHLYNYKLDYISIMNTYSFVDCVYISLYWLYIELLQNSIGKNILTFISSIDRPYDKFINNNLEFTMLGIGVKEVCEDKNVIDNYYNDAFMDSSFIVGGSDINEIENELEQYGVINNSFIDNVKNIDFDYN